MMRLAALIATIALAACGAAEPRVRLTEDWPAQAEDYEDVTARWTRKTTPRDAYQEVLELAATLKSPEWRLA